MVRGFSRFTRSMSSTMHGVVSHLISVNVKLQRRFQHIKTIHPIGQYTPVIRMAVQEQTADDLFYILYAIKIIKSAVSSKINFILCPNITIYKKTQSS